ncbi:MAG: AMP-binding protein, partial [Limnohabitans sp.]
CWAGATFIPLGLKHPQERLSAIFQQCEFDALITDSEGEKLLSQGLREYAPVNTVNIHKSLDTHHRLANGNSFQLEAPYPIGPKDIAYIIFTSGSTGTPKGVMINAAAIRHYISTMTHLLALQSTDKAIETCELSFDVSIHNMFTTWSAGAQLHVIPSWQAMNAVKIVQQSKITVWNSVPSLAGILRQIKALSPSSMPTLRLSVFGGDQLPTNTVVEWQKAAPHSDIVNLYGPTEATVFCLWQSEITVSSQTVHRDIVAIGQPLPGNQACIVNDQGIPVDDFTPGELWIAGDQLADGYLNAAELTAHQFPMMNGQRWYRTGDLAIKDQSGVFHYLGRLDNQIKVLGHRVELEDVDAHVRTVTGSDLIGSVAWPVMDGMPIGIVSFVCGSVIDTSEAIQILKRRLPAYMVPSRLIELSNMPYNNHGKVDRKALRAMLDSEF